jgi:hypothetical protein
VGTFNLQLSTLEEVGHGHGDGHGHVWHILPWMLEPLPRPPLVRWDGIHAALDLDLIEHHLKTRIERVDRVSDLSVGGKGDSILLAASVVWKGVRIRVRIELGELRLKRRFLGLRLRRLNLLGGVPVPMGAVEILLQSFGPDIVRVFRGQAIVVVDLREWVPEELDLSLLAAQTTDRTLHLWFGPGSLRDLPTDARPALPATGVASTTR